MLKPITARDPLDDVEDELTFTISALNSDPLGAGFITLTATWVERLDEVRRADRKTRRRVVSTDARRVIANENLDSVCEAFGAALFEAVGQDERHERWRAFFEVPVHSFVRQALRTQVQMVERWFESSDPALDAFREPLQQWVRATTVSLEDARALAVARAENQMRREHLAEDLSRERDALISALSMYAEDHGLPASWPRAFFRRTSHVWVF